jgi:hypothetical protein
MVEASPHLARRRKDERTRVSIPFGFLELWELSRQNFRLEPRQHFRDASRALRPRSQWHHGTASFSADVPRNPTQVSNAHRVHEGNDEQRDHGSDDQATHLGVT